MKAIGFILAVVLFLIAFAVEAYQPFRNRYFKERDSVTCDKTYITCDTIQVTCDRL